MSDHSDIEPVPGLPEPLPPGETILWQGTPDWRVLARTAFHTRKIAIYFGVLALWRVAEDLYEGDPIGTVLTSAAGLVPAALLAVAIVSGLAFLSARATVYTITTRRVVMRFGVALPLTVNVPYRIVVSAGLQVHRDGTGDIPLAVAGQDRIAYLALWPHARPWRVARPEPMLRAVPEAARVADILAQALHAAGAPAPRAAAAPEPAAEQGAPAAAAAA